MRGSGLFPIKRRREPNPVTGAELRTCESMFQRSTQGARAPRRNERATARGDSRRPLQENRSSEYLKLWPVFVFRYPGYETGYRLLHDFWVDVPHAERTCRSSAASLGPIAFGPHSMVAAIPPLQLSRGYGYPAFVATPCLRLSQRHPRDDVRNQPFENISLVSNH